MAGLMSRTMEMLKAKWSKLLDRAEKPAETLDYSYEKQLELLQNVKRGVADVTTAKKRLELQTQQLEQNVVKLETQAREAVAANREDLAKIALERKAVAQQQLQGLDQQVWGVAAVAGERPGDACDDLGATFNQAADELWEGLLADHARQNFDKRNRGRLASFRQCGKDGFDCAPTQVLESRHGLLRAGAGRVRR